MTGFHEMTYTELCEVDGGIGVVAGILIGACCVGGGFAAGYGLACWLG